MIISSPDLKRRGIVNHGMVSFIDILPTILHWAGYEPPFEVKSPGYNRAEALIRFLDLPRTGDSYILPGRSLLPVLEEENLAGFDTVFASHSFHESTMYYPMRSIRTRKYKYIVNIDNRCEFRLATDIFNCATWQGILKLNSKKMGVRSVQSYIYRPKEELYNIEEDPYETENLASDPAYKEVLKKLRKRVKEFQIVTDDIWLLRWIY
jgi:N-sulfoglucosamine sulfohydrolase